MQHEDVTDQIAWPCGWCGAPSVRLVPCEMPPLSLAMKECMFSGDYSDPHWRICARTGRFAGKREGTQ